MKKATCDICRRTFDETELLSGRGIRHEVERLIKKEYPDWNDEGTICKSDYNVFRLKYVSSLIEEETGEIKEIENDVLKSINENELIAANIDRDMQDQLSFGDKLADRIAAFGGSWRFILIFFGLLGGWILVNTVLLFMKPFDPYPFILLNLILSCIAAIQAPIIMMSQNRQEEKDRRRSENDYKVNLKSEIEIRTLHEKVDHLLLDQWSKMMRIQEIQIEILEEIKRNMDDKKQ